MNDVVIGQWIATLPDKSELLITVMEVDVMQDQPGYVQTLACEVAPRFDSTRWANPLPVRDVP